MFPTFIGILDIQSWWEVPSIAHFCSLFRSAFNLLDFDIEELEEALLTDGSEESASSLLTDLIVSLLCGCLGNNDISAFNYQMFLRRLFRQKCQKSGRYNPFNTDIDFQFLPLRRKVEILYALCDFRLDSDDVCNLFKNLEAESLRVEPLGWDDNSSAYWYFYGTRLYREDYRHKTKSKKRKGRNKSIGDDLYDDKTERIWQVVCFTETDWAHLTEKFSTAASKVEKELHQTLLQNFIPELPRLFQEKERQQRKRILELVPKRTSSRVLEKTKLKEVEEEREDNLLREQEEKREEEERRDEEERREKLLMGRENRAQRRQKIRTRSSSSQSDTVSNCSEIIMPASKPRLCHQRTSTVVQKPSMAARKPIRKLRKDTIIEMKEDDSSSPASSRSPSPCPMKTSVAKTSGRKTNNSLANATGQIVIPDIVESSNSCRKKLKTSQIFGHSEMELQTDMYKIIDQLKSHDDAWPFLDPVEEEYAPNYYSVIRRPMDLGRIEDRVDQGYYTDFTMFRDDFKLIVNNCRLYNGQENEYTKMVNNLQIAFEKLTARYIDRMSSSDEEIAVEFQIPAPSRKHKLKANSSHNDSAEEEPKIKNRKQPPVPEAEENSDKEKKRQVKTTKPKDKGHNKDNNMQSKKKHNEVTTSIDENVSEKKRKTRGRRHRKRSRAEKMEKKKIKESRRAAKKLKREAKLNKIQAKKQKVENKDEGRNTNLETSTESVLEHRLVKRADSPDSPESSSRSRSASPLPSIHSTSTSRTSTPSLPPSPFPLPSPLRSTCGEEGCEPSSPLQSPLSSPLSSAFQLDETDFYKDKYDKIKERRRQTTKNTWDSILESRPKSCDKLKQNVAVPEKEKNSNLLQTIEKLKEKNKEGSSIFDDLFRSSSRAGKRKNCKSSSIDSDSSLSRIAEKTIGKNVDEYEFVDDLDDAKSEKTLEEPKKKKQKIMKSDELSKKDKSEDKPKKNKRNNKHELKNTIEDEKEAIVNETVYKENKKMENETNTKKNIKKDKPTPSVTNKSKISDTASKKRRVKKITESKDIEVKEPIMDIICPKELVTMKSGDTPEQLSNGTEVNESAANALEQAVIDISKWLDEPPKVIDLNPPTDIPATSSSVVEQEVAIVKCNDEETNPNSKIEKATEEKKTSSRKEGKKVKNTKESGKVQRRRELQRTIDRLQPGKSKGNLLTNTSAGKPEEVITPGAAVKPKEIIEFTEECSPKLRLGSVLQTDGFGLGSPFSKYEEKEGSPLEESVMEQEKTLSPIVEEQIVVPVVLETAVVEESIETPLGPPPLPPATPPLAPSPTPQLPPLSPDQKVLYDENLFQDKDFDVMLYQRQCQEKVTPNLSAWFKAFGTPKPGSAPPPPKKKVEGGEEPKPNKVQVIEPLVSKHKSPLPETASLDPEGQAQVLNMLCKQRRMSTGSSVSERSSFSQDLDSPRHQVSHSSPLLRSPASPREEFQKILYPIHNGTVRAGFYQDTASVRSSPDKSCSPRDPSQSPYSPYSQHHVYASGNATGSSNQTPIYFVDNTNKSPLPTYGQNQPPPYYDTSKASAINKSTRPHDDYTALGPNSPFQPPLSTISPGRSPYSQHSQHSPYAPVQRSPQTGYVSAAPSTLPQSVDPHELMASKRRISAEAVIEEIQSRVPGVCMEAMEKIEKNLASVMPSPNNPPFRPTGKCSIPKIVPISEPVQLIPVPEPETIHPLKMEIPSGGEETSQSNSQQSLPTTPTDLSFINMPIIKKCEDESSNDRSKLAQIHMTHEDSISSDTDLPIDMVKLGYGNRVANAAKSTHVDMINMGYYNTSEIDNRLSKNDGLNMSSFGNVANLSNDRRNNSAAAKAYDMLNAAMNLGVANPIVSAAVAKPAHLQTTNVYSKSMLSSVPEKRQNQYNLSHASMMQGTAGNFGRADIDLLSKKYYSSTDLSAQASAEFANWKMDAQTMKQETAYQNMYANDNMDMSKKININVPNPNLINYNNKTVHQSQSQSYPASARPTTSQRTAVQQLPSELRIPNPRGIMNMSPVTSHNVQDMKIAENELAGRLAATNANMQAEKNLQMMGALQYKAPYSHSANPLDALRNIPNLPQMLDRYATDERFLSSYPSSYHEKTLQMAQMFGKNVSNIHTSNVNNLATFSHASMSMGMNKESTPPINYKMNATVPTSSQITPEPERKARVRKKKTVTSVANVVGTSTVNNAVPGAVSSVPGSAFNFGPSSLGGSLYADNAGFLSELRNSTANQLMAANYMAAAAAQQQSLVPDPASPLYRQYLQRHRAAQMMGLYPPGYPPLAARQPYDTIDRPNWM